MGLYLRHPLVRGDAVGAMAVDGAPSKGCCVDVLIRCRGRVLPVVSGGFLKLSFTVRKLCITSSRSGTSCPGFLQRTRGELIGTREGLSGERGKDHGEGGRELHITMLRRGVTGRHHSFLRGGTHCLTSHCSTVNVRSVDMGTVTGQGGNNGFDFNGSVSSGN